MLGGLNHYLVLAQRPAGPAHTASRRSAVDLITMPLLIAMQALAGAIFLMGVRQVDFTRTWVPLHVSGLIIATLIAAAAAAGGIMYLLLDRALRLRKPAGVLGTLPSLERLEKLMQHALLGGFLLLTVAIVTGVLITARMGVEHSVLVRWLKLYPAIGAWVLFALGSGVRFAPQMRGRPRRLAQHRRLRPAGGDVRGHVHPTAAGVIGVMSNAE